MNNTIDNLKDVANSEGISTLLEFFGIGRFYKRFDQGNDIDVKEIMKNMDIILYKNLLNYKI